MKLLILSRDSLLLEKDSAVFLRHQEYAKLLDSLYVLVIARVEFKKPIASGNLFVYPWFYFFYFALNLRSLNIKGISTQDPLISGLFGCILWLIYKIPWQIQVHGDFLGNAYWLNHGAANVLWQKVALFFLKNCSKVRAVSKRVRRNLVSLGIDEKKIFVLPIYTEVINGKWRMENREKEDIVLYTGRLSWEKNLYWLIESWAKIASKYPSWKLNIVGDGEEGHKLKVLTKKLNISHQILFYHWQDDILSFYEKASIFALPSFFEGWGRSAIEAMAFECAVVMSNVGLAGEILRNQENGLVVELSQEESLSRALSRLIEDKEYRAALGIMARDSVKNLPSRGEYLEQWLNSI